jgi:superfamily II DNA/RNA helicase
MKTLLLKRMDSSFHAFRQTLNRFIQSSEIMLKMIENNKIFIAPNIRIEQYILEDREDDLTELLAKESLTGPSIIICSKVDFEVGFVEGVKHDYKMLRQLKADWDEIIIDPKLDEFLKQLPNFLDKQNNPEQKIVIFTESTDTMLYISDKIEATDYRGSFLAVNAKNRTQLKKIISQDFDASMESNDKKNDYQIIITTDVLAEGVNLHRANTVINYDTPWNATKLIQRMGRVNRIGQMAEQIFVYNFYPTEQINQDIGLEKRAVIKLQAFHSALGEDSQIYSIDEETGTFRIFDENIQAEENKLMPFLEEIRDFREHNPEDYKRIKDLPGKVRCGVKNKRFQNQTLIFARTEGKGSSCFYLIKATGKVEHYNFIKTAKLLKCTPDTKAVKLHEQHYPQVLSALANFRDEIQKNIVTQTQNKSLSTTDTKAINFLRAIQNLPETNNDEQTKIKQAIKQIENKTFLNLTRSINKLKKNSKGIKPIVVLEKTMKIIAEYDINQHIQINTEGKQNIKNTTPTIVISQSYS